MPIGDLRDLVKVWKERQSKMGPTGTMIHMQYALELEKALDKLLNDDSSAKVSG